MGGGEGEGGELLDAEVLGCEVRGAQGWFQAVGHELKSALDVQGILGG